MSKGRETSPNASSEPPTPSLGQVATLSRYLGSSLWRRRVLGFVSGALSALALAPFHVWPVMFLTIPVLVWLLDGSWLESDPRPSARPSDRPEAFPLRRRTAEIRARFLHNAQWGWWWGFGYFLFGLFWIGEAFLVEPEIFGWLLPFAVTLMPAGLALFMGLATGIAGLLWCAGWPRILLLAGLLGITEWLRGHILTGFPWSTIGYVLTYPVSLMQSAALVGIFGLTIIAVVVLALPAVVWVDSAHYQRRSVAGRYWGALVSALVLATAFFWGDARLQSPSLETDTGIKVRIVQPSTPQREKWRPENQRQIFEDLLALSVRDTRAAGGGALLETDLLVWPEAAMPFLPLEHPEAIEAIRKILPPRTQLAAGALRIDKAHTGDGSSGRPRVFNSLLFFSAEHQPSAIYDKIHLVPFGEYLPMQGLLEAIGLRQLTKLRGGFASGKNPRPFIHLPGLPRIEPLICYEAIFPGEIGRRSERPQLLLNVTNDGWFGNTTGPRQHLHMARVRAVEQGVSLVRAANNGISAIVDPYGRLRGQLGLNDRGTLDGSVPGPIQGPIYAHLGERIFVALLVLTAIIHLLGRRLGQNGRKE